MNTRPNRLLSKPKCTVYETAELMGVSRGTVYNWIARGEIKVVRIGRRIIIPTVHLRAMLGLEERRRRFRAARGGVELLEAYVDFWCNYIPEIYGVARALLEARESDEAAAAAWDDRMDAVRASCCDIIEALHRDGMLASEWSFEEATDLLWTMLSIRNWESLTIECGWSQGQYVDRVRELARRTFVRGAEGA